jgi:arylsulfatase
LFVSVVNPHDIMYFNTDAAGPSVQDTGRLLMHAARAPSHPDFNATWNVPPPKNLTQPFDEAGRAKAHGEFDKARSYTLGRIPPRRRAGGISATTISTASAPSMHSSSPF